MRELDRTEIVDHVRDDTQDAERKGGGHGDSGEIGSDGSWFCLLQCTSDLRANGFQTDFRFAGRRF